MVYPPSNDEGPLAERISSLVDTFDMPEPCTVVRRAARELVAIGPRCLPAVLTALASGLTPSGRKVDPRGPLFVIARLGDANHTAVLVQAVVRCDTAEAQLSIIRTLGTIGDAEALPALLPFVRRLDDRLAVAAAGALAEIAERSPSAAFGTAASLLKAEAGVLAGRDRESRARLAAAGRRVESVTQARAVLPIPSVPDTTRLPLPGEVPGGSEEPRLSSGS
jgi:hypothetical protein